MFLCEFASFITSDESRVNKEEGIPSGSFYCFLTWLNSIRMILPCFVSPILDLLSNSTMKAMPSILLWCFSDTPWIGLLQHWNCPTCQSGLWCRRWTLEDRCNFVARLLVSLGQKYFGQEKMATTRRELIQCQPMVSWLSATFESLTKADTYALQEIEGAKYQEKLCCMSDVRIILYSFSFQMNTATRTLQLDVLELNLRR